VSHAGAESATVSCSGLVGMLDELRSRPGVNSVGLLLGKLRGLGKINSRHGYAAGDGIVAEVMARLGALVRDDDLALQVNGSMFALLIASPSHEGHMLQTADKVARQVHEKLAIDQEYAHLGISMGAAITSKREDSSDGLLLQAEAALRQCRDSGEIVKVWKSGQPTEDATSHPKFDAHQAIANGEFRVYYQPKIDLRSGRPIGVEALARWHGPDGLLPPASFLAELERSRVMAPLLRFVMNSASREMARWVRRMPDISVAVNTTTNDLEDSDLVGVIADMLDLWKLAPEHLVLEITETAIMRNPDKGIAVLRELRGLGIRTSIDDFGTGYSSLAYLKDLPVDEIKIDRSFVQNICEKPSEREILATIVRLGRAMGLQVVAEGIESHAVVGQLLELGCNYGQGFLFGQPVTGKEFEGAWLGK
jgi:diguanylate cyclase (GGDEF)-like protein